MASPPDYTSFHVPQVAGQKRPAPSLLPAFEPLPRSPKLPRPASRNTHAAPFKGSFGLGKQNYLPSAPTSSTDILTSSSPPHLPNTRRPGLQRTVSALSERIPLATVPSIELDERGEPTLMGRSSNSSHYQISTNQLVSRVHVRAVYVPATATEPKSIQIECTGWNGVKVHCQGRAWDLFKGDTFTSETEDSDIMVDVHDARVLVTWPRQERKALTPTDSDGTWDSGDSPSRRAAAGESVRSRGTYSSPLRQQHRLQSPVSPSPAVQAMHAASSGYMASDPPIAVPVQIYEDEPCEEEKEAGATQPTQSTHVASQPLHPGLKESIATESEPFSDNDEENDPIISSFGPFGANLNGRMETFTTDLSPEFRRRPLEPLKEGSISPQRLLHNGPSPKRRRLADTSDIANKSPGAARQDDNIGHKKDIINFVINHLMYSPLSTTPLSTILQHVHAHIKAYHDSETASSDNEVGSSSAILQSLLQSTPCIGAVRREGKDAAGKQLQTEFYYIPERDDDPARREIVQDLGIGGRGLRSCRKSHKMVPTAEVVALVLRGLGAPVHPSSLIAEYISNMDMKQLGDKRFD
ncbi:MAG: hypothetical protein Q9163_001013 [Psora crenata]